MRRSEIHRGMPPAAVRAIVGIAGALVAALLLAAPAAALEQRLTAADGAANDKVGTSVAVEGDTLVVGAPSVNGFRGAVYVYGRSGDAWALTAKLTASDASPNDGLGSAVAIDGDTIVAGASFDTIGANSAQGSVYVFTRTGPPLRNETGKLTASDGLANDRLGASVGIDGDTIVAGALLDDVGVDTDRGSAYTFARAGAPARSQTAKLTASDGDDNDRLGNSVSIDGDTIVVGADHDDLTYNNQGSAYTFTRSGFDRIETAKLTATDGTLGDSLGTSVAIDGDTIVAGASHDKVGANADQGSVYTFARAGTSPRTETAKMIASDGGGNDQLGFSVAIDGDTIVAGAFDHKVGANMDQGAAYTFARTGAPARTETGVLTASDGAASDAFGYSVAIAGDTIVAGAPLDDVGTDVDRGSATVFFAPAPAPPVPDTTPPETGKVKGPKTVKRGKKAKFKFSSNEPGSTFTCRLDKKAAKPCTSPYKLKTKRLKPGKHTLLVTATDAAGNADATPSKRKFKVVGKP